MQFQFNYANKNATLQKVDIQAQALGACDPFRFTIVYDLSFSSPYTFQITDSKNSANGRISYDKVKGKR